MWEREERVRGRVGRVADWEIASVRVWGEGEGGEGEGGMKGAFGGWGRASVCVIMGERGE